jgi:hypothetical protein
MKKERIFAMKYSKERNSNNAEVRNAQKTNQPHSAEEKAPGYGDKKLDGPNRPST